MSEGTFFTLFMVVWFSAMAYLLSVWRLAISVRSLKREGKALDAPDIHFNLPQAIPGSIWLITGRYAKLGDDAVTRWSTIARILLFLVFPAIVAVTVIVATGFVTRP